MSNSDAWYTGRINKRQIERQEELDFRQQKTEDTIQTLKNAILRTQGRIDTCDRVLATGKTTNLELPWVKRIALIDGRQVVTGLRRLTKEEVLKEKSLLITEKHDLSRQLNRQQDRLNTQISNNPNSDGGDGGSSEETAESPPVTYSDTVKYNASSVKESYFYTGMSFVNKADPEWQGKGATDKYDSYIWSGNTPGKVDDANQLWKETLTSSSKGMIQTWKPPGGRGGYINPKDSNFTTLATAESIQRYGFQFLYNPTTIDMSYGGVPDIDPGLQSSGNEEFLLSNPGVFQSSVGIQVVINRMFDFQYINENGIKTGEISDFYAGNVPTKKDLQNIYKKGTMYDVEYLLQTMFPYEPVMSQLRGETSDIGFLGASPVELHLGTSLRYVAQINNISVNHVIFDNRMVPLFTTISVSTNRIPDYQGSDS
jgi:hypothetical protein